METLQPINIETFKGLISNAPTVFEQNSFSIRKATARYNELLEALTNFQKAEANYSKEGRLEVRNNLRTQLNNYLVALKKTYDLLKERRTPVTGLFDDFKRQFTAMEAQVDPKGQSNLYSTFQEVLNRWAKEDADEAARVQAELKKQQATDAERIQITSEIELQLRKYFLKYLDEQQVLISKLFEGITLATFEESANLIFVYNEHYPIAHFEAFTPNVYFVYLNQGDIINIKKSFASKFSVFEAEYRETIQGLKEVFTDKLASKKTELEELAEAARKQAEAEKAAAEAAKAAAEASAAEKAELEKKAAEEREKAAAAKAEQDKLEADKKERERVEAERISKGTADKEQTAQIQVNTNAQIKQANLAFESESKAVQAQPTQRIKEGYNIKISGPAGWLQIVAFYFEKEGMKKGVDDLGKMKLESMKTFAEKHALKTGEKITNPYLVYEETYKAVVK